MKENIRITIIHESEFLRLGLQTLLKNTKDICVIGNFTPDGEVTRRIGEAKPDLILIGTKWPNMTGCAICQEVLGIFPSAKVLMLSSTESEEEIVASMMSGAVGCISSNSSRDELLRAIKIVVSGGLKFDWTVTERILIKLREMNQADPSPDLTTLSKREISILAMIGAGYSNEEIAFNLNLATSTIRNNITNIRFKLNLHSRAKLIVYALKQGLQYDSDRELNI